MDAARCHLRHLRNRARRLDTPHDLKWYRKARRAFTSLVRRAKALAWRNFCAKVNRADMWPSVQRILKPRQRLHVADLHDPEGRWIQSDEAKARLLAERFFPAPCATSCFQDSTALRLQEVNAWLQGDWGPFPAITLEEVQAKILMMRAFSAPGPDGVIVRCLQEARGSVSPVLRDIFQMLLQTGTYPSLWTTARILPVPKPGADPHQAKGYRPIALLNVLGKVLEGIIKDRLTYLLETCQLLSPHQQGFRAMRSTDLALWRFVSSAS